LQLSDLVAWNFRASHSVKAGMFFALEKNKKSIVSGKVFLKMQV